jgi:predicted nucleic acid-binding Zn ribbon protein
MGEVIAAAVLGVAAVLVVLGPVLRRGAAQQSAGGSARAFTDAADLDESPRGVALAALKEIEFDRETGKLSDDDYDFLKRKYTAIALETLRAEDADAAAEAAAAGAVSAQSDAVEALIAARVRALRVPRPVGLAAAAGEHHPAHVPGAAACPTCGPRSEPDAVFCSSCGTRVAVPGGCAHCGAPLLPDSRFCERCGVQVAA